VATTTKASVLRREIFLRRNLTPFGREHHVRRPPDFPVTRIDRLARSTFDPFGIVKRVVDAKAQFRSLAEPWVTPPQARDG
jgi:hypothetical protein